MNHFIKHIVFFLVACCLVQVACNNLVLKHFNIPYRWNKRFATKYENYAAKKDQYNTLFIGSSRIYRHISPQIIDQELEPLGVKSYNLGTPGTFMPETFYLLDMILDSQYVDTSVRFVFMELNQVSFIMPENWFAPQSYYYLDLAMLENIWHTLSTTPGMSKLKAALFAYPYIQGYLVKNIVPLVQLDFKPEDVKYTGESRNGYYPLDIDLEQNQAKGLIGRHAKFLEDTTVVMKRREQQLERPSEGVSVVYAAYLNQLVKRADQLNIKLFFIIPPKLKYYQTILGYKEMVYDERVIDTESFVEYPVLNLSRYNYDKGHFNHHGAELYSTFVAQKIAARLNSGADTVRVKPVEILEPGH